MDKYYFIAISLHGTHKRFTYTQVLKYMENSTDSVFKVLKTDYKAIENAIKGVMLPDKVKYIFNRLHSEKKTSRL